MKNYGYDFMNYTSNPNMSGYQDMMMPNYMMDDYTSNMNFIPQVNNQGINSQEMKMKKDQIIDPMEGFRRGNLFGNLYDPYKNYKPANLNPTTEREALLEQLQQYSFALIELDLYLDTHPNDREALDLYNKYLEIKKQICDKYESSYGPITLDSNDVAKNNWNWINGPWPWEGVK